MYEVVKTNTSSLDRIAYFSALNSFHSKAMWVLWLVS